MRALVLLVLLGAQAHAHADLPNLVAVPVNQAGKPSQAPVQVNEPSYRSAFWRCADATPVSAGGETSCKSTDVWAAEARDACRGHCRVVVTGQSRIKKCGLMSFYVKTPCP